MKDSSLLADFEAYLAYRRGLCYSHGKGSIRVDKLGREYFALLTSLSSLWGQQQHSR